MCSFAGQIFTNWKDKGVAEYLRELHAPHGRVVVANGVFDLGPHLGHLQVFETARAAGSCVIAAVNSDESVYRLRGRAPYVLLPERLKRLAALRTVDIAVGFDEDTPAELLAAICPHVLVKGAEYADTTVPGIASCGRVIYAPKVEGYSTTELAERVYSLRDGGVWRVSI